jgi:hypothetical protein
MTSSTSERPSIYSLKGWDTIRFSRKKGTSPIRPTARYGSRASGTEPTVEEKGRYDSVTRTELDVAIKNQIPTYILIERSVHAEYSTYLKNKEREVNYAHVDSVEIFRTIEKVLALPQNNPVQQFDRFEEIARWLKEQWGGYFQELLQRRSTDQKITDLAEQVASLQEINVTLKRYLENLVTEEGQAGAASTSGAALVRSEQERLARAEVLRQGEANVFLRYARNRGVPEDVALDLLDSSSSPAELEASVSKAIGQPIGHVMGMSAVQEDINKIRTLLGKPEFKFVPISGE